MEGGGESASAGVPGGGRQAGRRGVFFSRGRGLKSLPSLSGSGRMGLSWTDFLVKLLW